ncbi:MAG TPA: DUF4198 domain-containing protein [Pyrinomonadaceae bacterium]|nr:DUF4198 domain-containing protein [Pyrinomonadaceae bacterium]
MLRKLSITVLTIALLAISVTAHDLFLKLDSYFLPPNSKAVVRVLNGTFQKSDGAVARERLADLSVFSNGTAASSESIAWRAEEKLSVMEIQTGGPGTYLVGISTRPREIELRAADFNSYLAEDGLPDILAARKKSHELGKDARERYSKHVRAVFQVGDLRTDDYKRPLNYPVEIIPQENPYSLKVGQTLPVLCLLDGKPLANQFVIAGWESHHGKIISIGLRTNARGIARFKLSGAGKWFVKLIHMVPVTEANLNYESKWATLTFDTR